MKICPACQRIYEENISKCENCGQKLLTPGKNWIIVKAGKYHGQFSTLDLKREIKQDNISAYDLIFSIEKKKFIRLLESARFRTAFSRTGNWSIRLKEKIYYPLSREQIDKLIQEKKLTGKESCYHPSVNEWRPIKEYMEFGYKFGEEYKYCNYCGAKNTSSSIICWKCLNPLLKSEKAKKDEREELLKQDLSLPEKESYPTGENRSSKISPQHFSLSFRNIFLIVTLIFLIIAIVYFFKNRVGFFNSASRAGGVVVMNSRFVIEERDYDDYSVSAYIITGEVVNNSSTNKKVIFLTGTLFNRSGVPVSKKTIEVYKQVSEKKGKIFTYPDIKKGDRLPFRIYFYFHELRKENITSWDVEVVKVLEK